MRKILTQHINTLGIVLYATMTLATLSSCTSNNSANGLGSGGGGGNGVGVGPVETNPDVDPGASPFRRITNVQYNNVMRDLFGITNNPSANFPSDDSFGTGFPTGTSTSNVTEFLADEYAKAAKNIAEDVIENKLAQLLPCNVATEGDEVCVKKFIDTYGLKLFRRPLDAEDSAALLESYQAGKASVVAGEDAYRVGLKVMLRRMLQSPYFLYRIELSGVDQPGKKVGLTSFEMASRLSFLLWNTTPDDELIRAAQADELVNVDHIKTQVARMLADDKAKETIKMFYTYWLDLWKLGTLVRQDYLQPGTNWENIQQLMRTEANMVMDELIWEKKNLQEFFTLDHTYMNQELATFYYFAGSYGTDFQSVPFDDRRRGVMTLGGIMASVAVPERSSPTKRGNFVISRILCQNLPPVPRDVNPVFPVDDPNVPKTTREKVAFLMTTEPCNSCHRIMDPIGYAFESFDARGRWRDMEAGKAVDSSGTLNIGDISGSFTNVAGFNLMAKESEMFSSCVSKQIFRFAMARLNESEDKAALDELTKAFTSNHFDFLKAIEQLTVSDTFRFRKEQL